MDTKWDIFKHIGYSSLITERQRILFMKQHVYFFIFFISVVLCNQTLLAGFEEMADVAGFIYDEGQDIYISRADATQRVLGYNKLFDFFSPLGNMIIDTEPVVFNYDKTTYMIEIWKGQYYASTGAELGIYTWNGIAWDAVKNEDMLPMAYTLKRKERALFYRQDRHWWLTGFFPGVFSDPDDLVMEDIYIEFKTTQMRDAFLGALLALGYNSRDDKITAPKEDKIIIFTFSDPKSEQLGTPWERLVFQIQNRMVVRKFNKEKARHNRTDNSPETIDAVLGLEDLPF
jgi:hypothetical protein